MMLKKGMGYSRLSSMEQQAYLGLTQKPINPVKSSKSRGKVV